MLALSEQGDDETVDMLVGDIYGSGYSKLGLKSTMIASTFGKVFKKQGGKKRMFKAEDISKSLLYAISNNIGQIAYVMFCSYSVGTRFLFVRRSHAGTDLGTRLPAGSNTRGIPMFWAVQNRINYGNGECHVSYSILLNVEVQVSGCSEC